jgi:hypothetical protein
MGIASIRPFLSATLFALAACGEGTDLLPPAPKSVSGAITLAGAPLAGAQLLLWGPVTDTVVSGADGHYSLDSLPAGLYQVTPKLEGHAFRPASRVVLMTGADEVNRDFAAEEGTVHSISGTVTGASLVTVTVSGDNTGEVLVGAGAAAGTFTIPNLRLGSYIVAPSAAGKAFAPVADTIDGVMDFNHLSSGGIGPTTLASVTQGPNDRAACFAYFPLNPPEGIGSVRPKRTDEVLVGFEATCDGMWAAQETILLTYASTLGTQAMTIQLGPNRTWVLTAPNYELSERMVGGTALAFTATPP